MNTQLGSRTVCKKKNTNSRLKCGLGNKKLNIKPYGSFYRDPVIS
jgi:hypothetical protein